MSEMSLKEVYKGLIKMKNDILAKTTDSYETQLKYKNNFTELKNAENEDLKDVKEYVKGQKIAQRDPRQTTTVHRKTSNDAALFRCLWQRHCEIKPGKHQSPCWWDGRKCHFGRVVPYGLFC